jgi:hypothetical protein
MGRGTLQAQITKKIGYYEQYETHQVIGESRVYYHVTSPAKYTHLGLSVYLTEFIDYPIRVLGLTWYNS